MREKILEILPNLRRFSYALTGNKHDADDLLQSTVERLLVKPVPADIDAQKWAFRVCRNMWIDEIRKRKVRQSDDIADSNYSSPGQDGEAVALSRITLTQINDAMDRLPENQRSTLAMASVAGLSYAEISEVLDVPIGTVMSRIARARKTLAVRFSETVEEISEFKTGGAPHDLH